ncbi:MAG TPA: flagellar hook-basal body complex protein FliE [Caproiciproducens sp.]|nr:flagellar hook-basal body complex protein FliE [Caproiciproducens sp.]
MQITPIERLNSISDLSKTAAAQPAETSNSLPFQSLFEDAVNNVKTSDSNLNQEVYKLATGQSDNLHDITIASQKATLSVQMLVQLRDKVLDAYNEVMRMGV